MKLHKIELIDFRQFKGKQSIEFSDSEQKNVTVIYGENGRGKTGIFRALMYCLYGERSLPQDELDPSKEEAGLTLINLIKLEENKGKPISAIVKIDFSHKNEHYSLSRSLTGMMNNEGIVIQDQNDELEFQKTDKDRNTSPIEKDQDTIHSKIQDILNSRLRDYFLFDGERIERLTRDTVERRNEVRKGIRALLNLDALELATRGLSKFVTKVEKDIKNKSTGEVQEISERIDQLNEDLESLGVEIDNTDTQLRILARQEKEISEKISENELSAEMEEKRKKLREQIKDKEQEKSNLARSIQDLLNKGGQLILFDHAEQLREELDLRRNKGELPPAVRMEFIDKLLTNQRCICGACLDENNSEAREILLDFKEKVSVPGLDKHAEELLGNLNKLSGAHTHISERFSSLLFKNQNIEEEILDLDSKIKTLDEEIGKGSVSIEKLVKARQQIAEDRINLEKSNERRNIKIEEILKRREEFRKRLETLAKQEERIKRLINRRDAAEVSFKKLNEIYTFYTKEMREKLEAESSNIFEILADQATKQDIKRISIDDNYMLNVLNWAGQRRLGEISAGQRQIVSLSFIMGLIRVAGNMEVPLFMDTPFGRLSGSHRDHLINNIPDVASQWTLLATDTEFTAVEADRLRKSGCWGKVYELIKIQKGVTEIKSCSVEQFVPKRKVNQ